jgi:hypothetical protein
MSFFRLEKDKNGIQVIGRVKNHKNQEIALKIRTCGSLLGRKEDKLLFFKAKIGL